ncbi:hypothetical protein AOLI_G00109600 [Acnodon oligacanthus]
MSINELELQRPVTFAEEAGQTDGVRDVPVATPLFTLPAVKKRAGVTMSEHTQGITPREVFLNLPLLFIQQLKKNHVERSFKDMCHTCVRQVATHSRGGGGDSVERLVQMECIRPWQNSIMIGGMIHIPVQRGNWRSVWCREADVTLSGRLFFTWFSSCPVNMKITTEKQEHFRKVSLSQEQDSWLRKTAKETAWQGLAAAGTTGQPSGTEHSLSVTIQAGAGGVVCQVVALSVTEAKGKVALRWDVQFTALVILQTLQKSQRQVPQFYVAEELEEETAGRAPLRAMLNLKKEKLGLELPGSWGTSGVECTVRSRSSWLFRR